MVVGKKKLVSPTKRQLSIIPKLRNSMWTSILKQTVRSNSVITPWMCEFVPILKDFQIFNRVGIRVKHLSFICLDYVSLHCHLLIFLRTSSRAKLVLHQDLLNPSKSRVYLQNPRGLKSRNLNHFSKIAEFFHSTECRPCEKKSKRFSLMFFLHYQHS